MKEAARGGRRSSVIQLSPVNWKQAKLLAGLLEAKQLELECLRLGFEQFIEQATGVDLQHEAWEVDLDRGVIVRRGEANGHA